MQRVNEVLPVGFQQLRGAAALHDRLQTRRSIRSLT
jgi:hypothetical protein